MTDSENQSPEQEIKSDESWKESVKAEDARLDAERAAEEQTTEEQTTEERTTEGRTAETEAQPSTTGDEGERQPQVDSAQLPQPEFSTLVGLFATQAMVSLGLIGHPEDGKTDVQLPLARHFIDLLGVLEEKTRGNLSDAEGKLLEQSLHDLRVAFLERSGVQ